MSPEEVKQVITKVESTFTFKNFIPMSHAVRAILFVVTPI